MAQPQGDELPAELWPAEERAKAAASKHTAGQPPGSGLRTAAAQKRLQRSAKCGETSEQPAGLRAGLSAPQRRLAVHVALHEPLRDVAFGRARDVGCGAHQPGKQQRQGESADLLRLTVPISEPGEACGLHELDRVARAAKRSMNRIDPWR